MELQLVEKGFDYVRKRKKWAFILVTLGFTGYASYRAYHAPFIARKRKKLSNLLSAFSSVADAVSDSSETIGIISKDLNSFLQSNSDQVPNSLNQISKIAQSEHFSDSLASFIRSVTVGVLRGYESVNRTSSGSNSNLVDQVFDKLLTPAGSGFASVVIGSFARNIVLAFYCDQFNGESNSSRGNGAVGDVSSNGDSDSVPTWVNVVCDDRCGELIGNCVQLFVSTMVSVYLDKTMHINTYDDFFAGLTNPKNEAKVRDMLVSVCNGAMECLVKTSHQVLTSSNSNGSSSSSSSSYLSVGETLSPVETSSVESKKERDVCGEEDKSGWVSKVSSTLAVPSNRRLVLDVTGRVTFETVKSFMEFILQTICALVRRCAHDVHEAVVEIVRYASAKFAIIVTICLSLCLFITDSTLVLVPA